MKLNVKQLRHRLLQPTAELMAEIGGVTPCGDSSYAYRNTGAPVLGVAHCDYVDCGSDHVFHKDGRVWSSRLDDRLGVYVLLDVLPKLGVHVDVLLTDDEERGKSTAQYFRPVKHDYSWMFQFDRRGTDAVCYDYKGFEDVAARFFKVGVGSFSDICSLDHLGICGLNVGTAYYDEHSLGSYADLGQLAKQVKRFAALYKSHCFEPIPHNNVDPALWWDEPESGLQEYYRCAWCDDWAICETVAGLQYCDYCATELSANLSRYR